MARRIRRESGIYALSLFVFHASGLTAETPDSVVPSPDELQAESARIGQIRIRTLNVFDVGGVDRDTPLARLGNRLHVRTREATIQDQLLFRSGEEFRSEELDETARILRRSRYLGEAAVRPAAYHDGLVDVEVTTQDVWSLNPGISFGRKGGRSTSGFKLEDVNFLGTGSSIGVGVISGPDRQSTYLQYYDRQLGSTWWSLGAHYEDNSDGRLRSLSLDHPFYSLGSRSAGGVMLSDDRRVDARYDLGLVADRYEVRERQATAYWGASTGLVEDWARRATVGLTYHDNQFASAPGRDASFQRSADQKLVYPWVGMEWIQDDFVTVRNRDRIARTEDVSLGWRLRTRLGLATTALGSDRKALVFVAGVARGVDFGIRQTLLFDADISGRSEGSGIAGSLLNANVRYYYQSSPRRLFYANLSATAGFHIDADQQILLGGDNGLRGYPLRYQAGTGKWLFTAEQRFFTDWHPFDLFNVGAALFYDMGAARGRVPFTARPRSLLRDAGFGLRLGNSRSSRGSMLHLDLAFPLDGGPNVHGMQFQILTSTSF